MHRAILVAAALSIWACGPETSDERREESCSPFVFACATPYYTGVIDDDIAACASEREPCSEEQLVAIENCWASVDPNDSSRCYLFLLCASEADDGCWASPLSQ